MSREVQILLVEDNPADARLVTELLKDGQLRHRILHVSDGVEALAQLRAKHPELFQADGGPSKSDAARK